MSDDDFMVVARWDEAGGFFPLPSTLQRCGGAFKHGERLVLTVDRERSAQSHRHYFARIKEIWASLPESVASAPYAVSPESLRKHALIASGYCTVSMTDAGSKAAAERFAALIPAIHRDYCVVIVRGPMVMISTAESQSVRAMGGPRFQASKDAVLGWCEAQLRPDETRAVA